MTDASDCLLHRTVGTANKWLKSISILSRIVLNEDVSISLMNPVDEDKNAFDDYDGYEFGMNNTPFQYDF